MSDCCCAHHADTPEETPQAAVSTEEEQPQDQACCCAKYKATPRGEEFQADLQRRLNRAIGQLNGDVLEIKSGLKAGDVLVTEGFGSLYEGQFLTLK